MLAAALLALAIDWRHYGSGLPDLLLLRAIQRTAEAGEGAPDAALKGSADWKVAPAAAWLGPAASEAMSPVQGLRIDEDDLRRPPRRGTADELGPPAPDVGLSLGKELRYEAMLVEVKGPDDRLSDRQRAWIAIFLTAGADCRIFRVIDGH